MSVFTNPATSTAEETQAYIEAILGLLGERDPVEVLAATPSALRRTVSELPAESLTVPEAGNFALDAGVFVRNCGIIVNVTPLEPTWEGHLTLEISNTTPLPAKIYAEEGIAQLLFFQGDEEPEVAYADRKGKYMNQRGVTLPKL